MWLPSSTAVVTWSLLWIRWQIRSWGSYTTPSTAATHPPPESCDLAGGQLSVGMDCQRHCQLGFMMCVARAVGCRGETMSIMQDAISNLVDLERLWWRSVQFLPVSTNTRQAHTPTQLSWSGPFYSLDTGRTMGLNVLGYFVSFFHFILTAAACRHPQNNFEPHRWHFKDRCAHLKTTTPLIRLCANDIKKGGLFRICSKQRWKRLLNTWCFHLHRSLGQCIFPLFIPPGDKKKNPME